MTKMISVASEVGKISSEVIECRERLQPAEKAGVEKDCGCETSKTPGINSYS